MKNEFLLYYISRAILSIVFSLLVMGFSWKAMLLALLFFGGFLLYLHSGWFIVDHRNPLLPLRRDPRGWEVQRKALITAVLVGMLLYLISPIAGNAAVPAGMITYFITQFILFARA